MQKAKKTRIKFCRTFKLDLVNVFVPLKFLLLLLFLPQGSSFSYTSSIPKGSTAFNNNYDTTTMKTSQNLDCKSDVVKSKLLHMDPPSLEIRYGNWTLMLDEPGKEPLSNKYAVTGFSVIFQCRGRYPVRLLYQLDDDDMNGGKEKPVDPDSFRNKVFYSNSSKDIDNFYKPSTYEFYVRDKIFFDLPKFKSKGVSCQGIDYPCLQQTAELSFSSDSTHLNISLLPKSKLGYSLPFIVDPPQLNRTDCEAFYYYQKIWRGDIVENYRFGCEFADGSPGIFQHTPCENKMRCWAMQRFRPEIKGCWREYKYKGKHCRDCPFSKPERFFTSFVAICQKGMEGTPDFTVTSTSSLAFYGVPKGENQTRPDIFFSESEVHKDAMIYLKPIPEEYEIGDEFYAECLLSGYYTSASFQFAIEYQVDGHLELELVPQPVENKTNWVPGFGGWQQKNRIVLNHAQVTRIYCSGQIQNTYEWINCSRPIQYRRSAVSSRRLVVTLVSSIFAVGIFLIAIVWFIFLRREERLLGELTEEQIKEFKKGRVKPPSGNRSSIYCLAYDKSFEVPRKAIEIRRKKLGEGEFGVVHKGYLRRWGKPKVKVAVKSMKSNVDVGAFLQFLGELKIMTYLGNHDNVVCLVAACTSSMKKCEAYACLEYCKYGNLKDYLNSKMDKDAFQDLYRSTGLGNQALQSHFNAASPYVQTTVEHDEMVLLTPIPSSTDNDDRNEMDHRRLSTLDLLTIAYEVANGLDYLATKKIIHGDAAARNIMLAPSPIPQSVSRLQAKIGDFGLSSQLDQNSHYIRKESHKPWRWTSPEVLLEHRYSMESDVWSYGATLYELFTLGDDPWPNETEFSGEFTQRLLDGHRLEKPDLANVSIYNLMLQCWKNGPSERPSFAEIKNGVVLHELQNLCPFHTIF